MYCIALVLKFLPHNECLYNVLISIAKNNQCMRVCVCVLHDSRGSNNKKC